MPRLLLIEDDPAQRALIRERFQDAYEVIESGDAASALALALQHRPDCVLLDLTLPEHSGFEVCQTLTSLSTTRLIPILVITAKPAEEYREFCLNLGAADYFEKPLDFRRLRACVDAIVDHKPKERRSEARIRMQVALRLAGKDATQKDFSVLTATEDVSETGFLASCGAPLKVGSVVEVYLKGKGHLVRSPTPPHRDPLDMRCPSRRREEKPAPSPAVLGYHIFAELGAYDHMSFS